MQHVRSDFNFSEYSDPSALPGGEALPDGGSGRNNADRNDCPGADRHNCISTSVHGIADHDLCVAGGGAAVVDGGAASGTAPRIVPATISTDARRNRDANHGKNTPVPNLNHAQNTPDRDADLDEMPSQISPSVSLAVHCIQEAGTRHLSRRHCSVRGEHVM
jgi:hypothetical protein